MTLHEPFYVVLIVSIICIHMITLGSPCKRYEVLARVGMTRIAKQEVLPKVLRTWIDDQAKIGMILALISDSFGLILGHFPVFNVLKVSVSGFIRFQKQLR